MGNGKPLTPEKELLRLIEEDSGHNSAASQGERKLRGAFSLSAARGRWAFLKSSFAEVFRHREFSITSFNKLLGIVLLFMFLYTAVNITLSMVNLKKKLSDAFVMAGKVSFHPWREVSSPKELKYYLNEARKRDIFNIVTAKKEKETVKKEETQEVAKKVSYLKLVGIAWSDNPDAMIEDTHAKRTIFVKEGSTINNITVKKILKDKVILSLEGKDVELK